MNCMIIDVTIFIALALWIIKSGLDIKVHLTKPKSVSTISVIPEPTTPKAPKPIKEAKTFTLYKPYSRDSYEEFLCTPYNHQ